MNPFSTISFLKKSSFLLIVFIVFLSRACLSQHTDYSDSLQTVFKIADDTAKPRILVKAAMHYQAVQQDTAILLANKALDYCKSLHDSTYSLDAIITLGMAYQYKSEYYKSTEYFFKAIAKAEKENNLKRLGSCYNGVGINFYYLQDFDKAIIYLKKAAETKIKMNDVSSYATIVGNMAGVLVSMGKNKEALKELHEAESKLIEAKNEGVLGNLYNTFGSIYQMGYHNLDSAEYYYRKSLAMVSKEGKGYERFQISAYSNIGAVCILKNKLEDAEFNLKKALDLCLKLQYQIGAVSIYGSLSNLYENKGDYKKAFDCKTLQLNLKDTIFKADKEKEIAQLEEKYQSGKNKQLIQEQQLQLQEAKYKTLLGIIAMIVLIAVLLILLLYIRFKRNVQQQVEAAKEKFFSNVAHEIRTPLSMIQGPIKVVQSKTTDAETLSQLAMAERNIGRLNELINQMLTISKIDADKFVLNESFGNIKEFIEELSVQYKEQAKNKHQSFTVQVDFKMDYVIFDPDALDKIISNLVGNAIKYTPEKGKAGMDVSSDEEGLTIAVWDNGSGIAEADRESIFNRFYRTEEVQKSGIKGVGIGLSLVKELVVAMNGSIDVDSKLGEGTVFTVYIPLQKKQNTEQVKGEKEFTILLVEDDNDILAFNKKLLEENNFDVLVARNGNEALEVLKQQLPDLIITDMMMPGKTGADLLKEVRADINTEHIPVLVLSAKSSGDARIETLQLGAQAYLSKPFLPEELVLVVSNQLAILKKRKTDFEEEIKQEEKTTEERFKGKDPYTEKFFRLIFKHLDNSEFSVEMFADEMATNRSHFQRKIKSLTGFSPSELIKTVRLEKSKEFLIQKKGNITEVAYMSGFSSQSYFTKSFTQYFGVSPSQFLQEMTELGNKV